MGQHDWMPGRRDEQLAMAKTWNLQLPEDNGAWDIATEEFAEIRRLILTAEAAMHGAAVDRGSAAANARVREAFADLKRYMRYLHRRKFFSPPMRDADWIRLGLRVPDTIRTPQPVPSSIPEIETDSSVIRQLSFRLRDHGASSWGKPDHVHGMEFAWGIRDTRPALVDELPELEVATANPVTLDFEESERGSRVFFAARWINNTAQPGPWSDLESAIVP